MGLLVFGITLATEDLKIGDKFRSRINEAILIHDKLLSTVRRAEKVLR